MKFRVWFLFPILIILIMLISYIFFTPRDLYRNDCKKNLTVNLMFVYSYGCPHCKAELLKIKSLNLSNEFYMVDANDASCENMIKQYSDYLIYHKNSNIPSKIGLMVPTKICLKNNKTHVGEMEEEELKQFYESCVNKT
ncbi:MAG: hypothetical protein QXG39_06140 [Candidatus Aenigmatarchaeota archaeon]